VWLCTLVGTECINLGSVCNCMSCLLWDRNGRKLLQNL